MKTPINRRTLFMALGSAAVTVAAGTVSAQSEDLLGAIKFEDGKAIPEGLIEVYLEDTDGRSEDQSRNSQTHLKSDGGSKTIAFSLPLPAGFTALSAVQIVAHLERGDGWLLARGSAQIDAGVPLDIILNTVMY
jgi:hypothetical protein